MFVEQWELTSLSCTVIRAIIIASAFYTYNVNAKRQPDDPEKKDYAPYSPWLAPFTLPILLIIDIPILILSSLVFGIFLVVFPITLLLFRKPFLFKWIQKQALRLGNWTLKINTKLLQLSGFYTPVKQF
jgi:hypothetical protein